MVSHQESIDKLIEAYRQGTLNRRGFIQAVVALSGSLAAATSVLGPLGLTPAGAALVDPQDPDLVSTMVRYPGEGAALAGYLSRPRADGRYPGVIVIHENRGLNAHIQDVARRFAKERFTALGVDLLARTGGTAALSDDDARAAIGKLAQESVDRDLRSAFDYLRRLDGVRGDRIGVIGFCWGGHQSIRMATQVRDLSAAVLFFFLRAQPLTPRSRAAARVPPPSQKIGRQLFPRK